MTIFFRSIYSMFLLCRILNQDIGMRNRKRILYILDVIQRTSLKYWQAFLQNQLIMCGKNPKILVDRYTQLCQLFFYVFGIPLGNSRVVKLIILQKRKVFYSTKQPKIKICRSALKKKNFFVASPLRKSRVTCTFGPHQKHSLHEEYYVICILCESTLVKVQQFSKLST